MSQPRARLPLHHGGSSSITAAAAIRLRIRRVKRCALQFVTVFSNHIRTFAKESCCKTEALPNYG
jgi:hypothetical protein